MKSLLLILALLSVEAMAAPNRNNNRNRNSMSSRNNNSSRPSARPGNSNRPNRPGMSPNRNQPSRPGMRPNRNQPSRPGMRPNRPHRPARPVVRPSRPHRPFRPAVRPHVRPFRPYAWHPFRSISRSVLRTNAYRRYNSYGYGDDCMDRATRFYSYGQARNICKYVWSDSCFYELDQVMSIRHAAEMCESVDDQCFDNRLRYVGPKKAARQCN